MRDITNKITTIYQYDGRIYQISERKNFYINDIFIDGRDCRVKQIKTELDLFDVSFMAPELYYILEETII